MKYSLFFFVIFSVISWCYSAIDAEIENKNVDRTIDLTSQLVKISYKITLNHLGKKPINAYSFVLPENERKQLSFISAKDSSKRDIKITENRISKGVEFLMAFSGTGTNTPYIQVIYIETVFTKSVLAHPTSIDQLENQLVRYFGNLYFYSPYKTLAQKTTIQLNTQSIESHTQVKPVTVSDNQIQYGPFENIAAFTTEELVVHYENHSPFMTVTRLERVIEISHWGNIAIEETIDIVHSGALLKGSFSRYEFQRDTRNTQAAVKSYKTILPSSATGVYYRDTNGNISTSNMRLLKDSVELDLRPRYPLFGGWKTHYTLGYNVPSFEYLFTNGENYLLKMRVLDHIFDDMIVDEAVVKVILPEGCTNIKLVTPYPVTRHPDTLHYTYLDTFGRPVITFSKKNLVENHIHDFNLKYNFVRITMFQEPILVIAFLFILFVIVIICMRLDFSITKDKESHQHKE